jgi:integrase/recombinase XerC
MPALDRRRIGHMGDIGRLAARYVGGRVERHEVRPATAVSERKALRSFVRSFGARSVGQLGRGHVDAWLASLGGVAASTRRTYFGIVRRFCRWLVELGHVRRDPTVGIRAPKVPRSAPRALGGDDVAAVWRVLPDARARCIVTLMLDLGLRAGEVAALELGDIDRAAGLLIVAGKGGHVRHLPLTERTDRAIVAYLAESPPRSSTGPLVRSARDHRSPIGRPRITTLVADWLTAAGVKVRAFDGRSAHAFRHTAARELADVEPDLRVVQAFLGHADLATTGVYVRRLDTGQLRAALARRSYPAGHGRL